MRPGDYDTMPLITDPVMFRSKMEHMEAGGLYRLWRNLRGARLAPLRSELTVDLVGWYSPYIAIMEKDQQGTMRFRAIGFTIANIILENTKKGDIWKRKTEHPYGNVWGGEDIENDRRQSAGRGIEVDSIFFPGNLEKASTVFSAALEGRAGLIKGTVTGPERNTGKYELLILPFRSDSGIIDRILAGLWIGGISERPEYLPVKLDIESSFVTTRIGVPLSQDSIKRDTKITKLEKADKSDKTGNKEKEIKRRPRGLHICGGKEHIPQKEGEVIDVKFRNKNYNQDNNPELEKRIEIAGKIRLVINNDADHLSE